MQYTSLRPLDQPEAPTATLGNDEYAPDIFLDIFADDFYKVIKAFAEKRASKKHKDENSKLSI